MPTTLGRYTLMKTLGSGANSKVKLGLDSKTGKYFAVKILKKDNPANDEKFMELLMTEVQTMQNLNHPNIVNLMEYSIDGHVEKSSGKKLPVIYIVLELATGGELFDFVATTGKFSEEISRTYFHQLIEGLEYVHKKGVTHRDLKPENLLFDENFNLKIADFGFAAPIEGRDGKGLLKTKLGTTSYMAPEIHVRKPYEGASVDLFASAIILFIMISQHPPFTQATPEDPFYRLLCAGRADLFWRAHSKNKPGGAEFFSQEFMDLITRMLSFDPQQRLSLDQIKQHPWYTGSCASMDSITNEFAQRKAIIDQQAEATKARAKAEEANEIAEKKARRANYRTKQSGAHRGDAEEEEETKFDFMNRKRELYPFINVGMNKTQFFSSHEPQVLLGSLLEFSDTHGFKATVDANKYKVKIEMNLQVPITKEEMGVENLGITIKLGQVSENKFSVEVQKSKGDYLLFMNQFSEIKKFFDEMVDETI